MIDELRTEIITFLAVAIIVTLKLLIERVLDFIVYSVFNLSELAFDVTNSFFKFSTSSYLDASLSRANS